MKVASHTTKDIFDVLRPEWNPLLERSSLDLIFLTWEWQSTWWDVYQPGDLWLLTVRDDDDTLVGIAPWFIETTSDKERVLRTIGCVDVTDYLGLIVLAEAELNVVYVLTEYLADHRTGLDRVDLCNIPEQSGVLSSLAASLERCGAAVTLEVQDVCPVINLPATFTDYVQSLDKKDRHELKRKMRKAEGVSESLEWYIVDDSHDLSAAIDDFFHLMQTASPEKAVFLSDPKNVAFFRAIVPRLYQLGYVQMAFLKVNDGLAAAYLSFLYQNDVQVYNSGLDSSVVESGSPGIVLLAYLIRHAIEAGYHRFDFLRGNESYKYRMGATDTRVMNLVARFEPSST